MKVPLLFSLMFLAPIAFAETFVCTENRTVSYRLLLGEKTGSVILYMNSKPQTVEGKVEVNRVNDDFGDLTQVTLDSPTKPVDWKKEEKCWKSLAPNYIFQIRHLTNNKYESTVRRPPHIVRDPKKPGCSIPRVYPSLVTINCSPVARK